MLLVATGAESSRKEDHNPTQSHSLPTPTIPIAVLIARTLKVNKLSFKEKPSL